MDIEKTLVVNASPGKLWALLLDPQVMGGCVPGTESIKVLSDTEYQAVIKVKISFISARFNIKTRIDEKREPFYLRTVGSGDDASVASSLKQTSEIFLTELPDGHTEMRLLVKVDVLGRLGTFGLSVMKTKADRMWDEFAANLLARVSPPQAAVASDVSTADSSSAAQLENALSAKSANAGISAPPASFAAPVVTRRGWRSRLSAALAGGDAHSATDTIRIEIHRPDTVIKISWPTTSANECAAWLRDYLKYAQI